MARQPRSSDFRRLSPAQLEGRGLSPRAARYEATAGPQKGETVSKTYVDNLRAREAGYTGRDQARQIKANPEYQRLAWSAHKATGLPLREIHKVDSEFNRLFAQAYVVQRGRHKGEVRTQEETYRTGANLFSLLYYLGFVRKDARGRYLKRSGKD